MVAAAAAEEVQQEPAVAAMGALPVARRPGTRPHQHRSLSALCRTRIMRMPCCQREMWLPRCHPTSLCMKISRPREERRGAALEVHEHVIFRPTTDTTRIFLSVSRQLQLVETRNS